MAEEIFIIGLPRALRVRVEGRARQQQVRIGSILCDVGKQGTPILLPDPSTAAHLLRAYWSRVDTPYVLVLPYAPIPPDVSAELAVASELDWGTLQVVKHDDPAWPKIRAGEYFDDKFNNALYRAVDAYLFDPQQALSAREHFLQAAASCPRLLVPRAAVAPCDHIAPHRSQFITEVADALQELAEANGNVGPIDQFFENRGLAYAHTGGVTSTLELQRNGVVVHDRVSNIHLKRGDNTTAKAAVRCYFQTAEVDGVYYVAVIYAGPHPDNPLKSRIDLSE